MFYKILWIGMITFVVSGFIFLGTKGVTVTQRKVNMEISSENFFDK